MLDQVRQGRLKDISLPEIVRENSSPLAPIPTSIEPVLPKLSGVKSVLFDIYGTLFVSGVAEIGHTIDQIGTEAFENARVRSGLPAATISTLSPPKVLNNQIRLRKEASLEEGVEYPEVNILDTWKAALKELGIYDYSRGQLEAFAFYYECGVNPIWPMPNSGSTLIKLKERGYKLGIVSNAGFYTKHLFEGLLGQDLDQLGFSKDLLSWSYQHLISKPSLQLFQEPLNALQREGINPEEVLYIGNDMVKDIWPSSQLGFRTALFAGDQRSLMLREEFCNKRGLKADAVLTDLSQLLEIID